MQRMDREKIKKIRLRTVWMRKRDDEARCSNRHYKGERLLLLLLLLLVEVVMVVEVATAAAGACVTVDVDVDVNSCAMDFAAASRAKLALR